ncbi:uncharacterized protein LOC131946425 [Physella acuta]|uniref:uncharacterized protein LOC131946425 n=1 Tax=Physella acuta TaxID=109671 RepID=UPI0027DC7A40|nr:uncharacterized protein LOC131946425 [Physella acuta]
MRNSPWIHQRGSDSAPPVSRPRDPPAISLSEQDEMVERVSRPTESALYRQSLYWKLDSYMDRGFHSWTKMDLFTDSKNSMYTPEGSIKKTCKIRPVQKVENRLPQLRNNQGAGLVNLNVFAKPRLYCDNGDNVNGSTNRDGAWSSYMQACETPGASFTSRGSWRRREPHFLSRSHECLFVSSPRRAPGQSLPLIGKAG